MSDLEKAVKILGKALKKNKDFFYGWQSNIAVCMEDEAYKQKSRDSRQKIHEISNKGAINFLNMLIK